MADNQAQEQKKVINWDDDDQSDDYSDGDNAEIGQSTATPQVAKTSQAQAEAETLVQQAPSQTQDEESKQRDDATEGMYSRKPYSGSGQEYSSGQGRSQRKAYGGGYDRPPRQERGYRRGGGRHGYGEGGEGEGDNYRRQNRGPKRQQFQGEKFDKRDIDPNSNYRQYYVNDPEFFLKVMDQEPAPYNFKIHVFQRNTTEGQAVDDEQKIGKILEQYSADKVQRLAQFSDEGNKGDLKQRYLFTIHDKQAAVECFQKMSQGNVLDNSSQLKIFYVKPETLFMKYADVEADLWNEYEAKQRELKQSQGFSQKPRNQRPRRDGGPQEPESLAQVQASTGIKFDQAPPQFTRTKPKTQEAQAQQTQDPQPDISLGGKNYHRTITDQNKRQQQAESGEQQPYKRNQKSGGFKKRGEGETATEEGQQQPRPPRNNQRKQYNKGDNKDDAQNTEATAAATTEESKDGQEQPQRGQTGGRGRKQGGRGGHQKRYNQDAQADPAEGQKQVVYRKVKSLASNEGDTSNAANAKGAKNPPQSKLSQPALEKKQSSVNTQNRFSAIGGDSDE